MNLILFAFSIVPLTIAAFHVGRLRGRVLHLNRVLALSDEIIIRLKKEIEAERLHSKEILRVALERLAQKANES